MPRIAIKICGLSTPETLDAALKAGASHVGFVHFAKSPRHVVPDRLAQLAARVPAHVMKVAVVVNPDDALIERLAEGGSIDALQLHGAEPPVRLAAIRARFPGLAVWKAVPVKVAGDIHAAGLYHDLADLILFDPDAPFLMDRFRLRSKSKNTPFDGARMEGKVLATYVAGTRVFQADA